MKKKIITLSLAVFTFSMVTVTSSCKKDLEKIVDCLAESSLASIDASIDPANSKLYTFKVSYGGTHTLGTVKWKFGDGSEATTNGSETVTHTFADGAYKVTAEATITGEGATCNPVLEKNVVVN